MERDWSASGCSIARTREAAARKSFWEMRRAYLGATTTLMSIGKCTGGMTPPIRCMGRATLPLQIRTRVGNDGNRHIHRCLWNRIFYAWMIQALQDFQECAFNLVEVAQGNRRIVELPFLNSRFHDAVNDSADFRWI